MVPVTLLVQQQQQQQHGLIQGYKTKLAAKGPALSGVCQAQDMRMAKSIWKDLGSQRAADAYVQCLPAGTLNLSFSTAGLSELPDLSRLSHLETLAASFNPVGSLGKQLMHRLSPRLRLLNLNHT
jgi:Leucine-rich repeat (LRR) protein